VCGRRAGEFPVHGHLRIGSGDRECPQH
jgi:hypothetical protein